MANIISQTDTTITLQPSYGYAMKLAAKNGLYKFTRWIAVLALVAVITLIVLAKLDYIRNPEGSTWINSVLFVIAGAGMFFWFYKPSQIQANNERTITKEEYRRREANGTINEIFTREWA